MFEKQTKAQSENKKEKEYEEKSASNCRSVWHNHVKKTLFPQKKDQRRMKTANNPGVDRNVRELREQQMEKRKNRFRTGPKSEKKRVLIQQKTQDRRDICHVIKKHQEMDPIGTAFPAIASETRGCPAYGVFELA